MADCFCSRVLRSVILLVLLAACPMASGQQLTPEQMAEMLLTSARRAYNERQLPLATERFREFLKTHGGHKEANSARYGLGLALLETSPPDFQAASEALKPAADDANFGDRPLAKFHLACAHRGLGLRALEQAVAKPPEGAQHRAAATQQFTQAMPLFGEAATLLAARIKPPSGDAPLSEDAQWYARAGCDQAEMCLRIDKPQDAVPLVEQLLKDASLAKSRYRPAATYYLGYAKYQQKDFTAAGRALSQLAPFADPAFGVHARYLLARTHQLADERAEAAAHYAALLAAYDAQRKAAEQALKNPEALKNDPYERQRLESLVKNPPPDYIARAWFYGSVLMYEEGRFAEAAERLKAFATQYSSSPLVAESQLRLGFCQVQLKQYAEALKVLDPLKDHPQLGDQARGWIAKAQAGAADPANHQAYQQAMVAAAENYRLAADKAGPLAQADPSAKLRRADWLLARADAQQSARQFKEAAATYQLAIGESAEPLRVEQALQRLATAYHLAGQFKEADDACQKFQQAYPNSPLLAAVLFRHAENAFVVAEAAAANLQLPNRAQQLPQLYGEALKRYQKAVEKFPEHAHVNLARQGLALAHYRLGAYEEAGKVLVSIAEADRTSDLASVPYLLADCLLRTAPTDAEDALSAARLLEQVTQAIRLLEVFLAAQPQSPEVPDALLKLGNAQQQVALVMGEPQERNKALGAARQAYEKLIQQFGNHALLPAAVFERAKVLAQAGDTGGAINELNRFQGDPLKNASVAPLAVLRLSSLLRSQNKPADAANVLAQCRQQHEAAMLADPARSAWAPLVQYHQGLALREAGKLPEAQGVFDNLVKQFAGKPEAAEAAWRAGQCRKELAEAKQAAARTALAKPGAKPEELTAANTAWQDALKSVRETAQYFEGQFGPIGQQAGGSTPHLRLYYEAAWCQRILADDEINAAKQKLREEARKKLQDAAAKDLPAGQPAPVVNPPEIRITAVPMQPAEQKAREHYQALIKLKPEEQLALVARFELAEMHAQREETDAAIALLTQALDLDPPADLAEQFQLRLGSCYLAKNNPAAAAGQFALVAGSAQPAVAADARYRLGEALLLKQDFSAAIEQLKPFRDQEPLRNIPQVSDRALLRLGHAYAHAGQWDASRQTLEALVARYPQSAWREDARYGIGWSWQNQSQWDNAVSTYVQVAKNSAAEVGARAQLQIGLCRLAQKRYPESANALLVVPFTYDYPELSAMALCEASRAFVELKQPEQAANLLKKVIKEHGQGRWGEVARQRLAEIK